MQRSLPQEICEATARAQCGWQKRQEVSTSTPASSGVANWCCRILPFKRVVTEVQSHLHALAESHPSGPTKLHVPRCNLQRFPLASRASKHPRETKGREAVRRRPLLGVIAALTKIFLLSPLKCSTLVHDNWQGLQPPFHPYI